MRLTLRLAAAYEPGESFVSDVVGSLRAPGAAPRDACTIGVRGTGEAGGLLAMRRAGATTLAQDEDTSLVFGMPREAIAIGAATETLALEEMAPRMLALAAASGRAQRV